MASSSFSPSQALHNHKEVLDTVAIDFRQLRKEEKQRAKEKQRQTQSDDDGKVEEDTTASNKKALDDDDWPTDWLSSTALSSVPFTPDYTSATPKTVLYKSDFLEETKRTQLADWLQSLPESKKNDNNIGVWNTMKYAKRRVAMFEEPLPLPLAQLAQLFVDVGVFEQDNIPNHVLVNEYNNNQGILAHTDGPLYYSKTATISIGSDVLLYFKKRLTSNEIGMVENPVELQVLLENGSLVVFAQDAYTEYCHGIDNVLVEYASMDCMNAQEGTRVSRGNRISLTFRQKL